MEAVLTIHPCPEHSLGARSPTVRDSLRGLTTIGVNHNRRFSGFRVASRVDVSCTAAVSRSVDIGFPSIFPTL